MYEVKSVAHSLLPAATIACFAIGGALAGRKFCLGASYKVGCKVAELLGKENVEKWNQSGDHYLALAKKDAVRDLTFAAGFIAMGLASKCVHNVLRENDKTENEASYSFYNKVSSISKFSIENILVPVISTAYNWRGSLIFMGCLTASNRPRFQSNEVLIAKVNLLDRWAEICKNNPTLLMPSEMLKIEFITELAGRGLRQGVHYNVLPIN